MTNNNLYLDIHVLQTVPSSNLNRDDTGTPKTAWYGGVTRARVSSQSWKRAMRKMFNADAKIPTGLRTKNAAIQLAQVLQAQNSELSEQEAIAKAVQIFATAGIKLDKDNQTAALLLISQGQIDKLAAYALANEEKDYEKKALKAVLKGSQSLDLALFGRLVADSPDLNVEGSAQVAHALSTHAVIPEFDYFTAMDDLQPDDNAGAAMLGTVGFDSATFYRYANLNLHELAHNLGEAPAIDGAIDYLKSFVLSMPTGKQNSFANKTLPSYVMVTLRRDTPVNLVSAFEKPIQGTADGYMTPSITSLEQEFERAQRFVETPIQNFVLGLADTKVGDAVTNLAELTTRVTDGLKQVMQDADDHD